MKRGGPEHPKTYALAETLGMPLPYAVGILELLFHFAAEYAPRGNIGRWPDKRLADRLHYDGAPEALVTALVQAGCVDRDAKHRLLVHGWAEHMDNGTREKLRQRGESVIPTSESIVCCPQGDETEPLRGSSTTTPTMLVTWCSTC